MEQITVDDLLTGRKSRVGERKSLTGIGLLRKRLKERFNTTPEWVVQQWNAQAGKCRICGIQMTFTNRSADQMVVDHNWATGEARALLCRKCNYFLGRVERYREYTEKALTYLKEHE